MEKITKIIENCKNKLEKDPFECYGMGVFIIKFKDAQGIEGSKWHGSKADADKHYEELSKDKNIIKLIKDYRHF